MIILNLTKIAVTLPRRIENLNLMAKRFIEQNAYANEKSTSETSPPEAPAAGNMMAWQIERYGNEEVLQLSTRHPEPIIRSPEDIKVEVLATSANPIDTAMMGGYGSVLLNTIHQAENCGAQKRNFPIILGRDFAGRVEATGHNVSNIKPGDEVWGVIAPWAQGSHAQKVVLPASNVRRKAQNVTITEMAALPYVSVTAWSALQITGEMAVRSRGRRVLILGGAGGVGSVAVQMAKAWNAHVVATCRTDAVPLVESLGAHGVVDYTQPDFVRRLMEHGHFDIVLDAAGIGPDASIYADCLKHWSNAKYITLNSPLLRNIDQYGLALGLLRNISALVESNISTGILQKGASSRWGFFIPCTPCLDEIQRLVTLGKVSPLIQETFTFNRVPEAYRKMKEGHLRGKLVIDMSS